MIIKGKRIEGKKLGRELGFPTVNLRYDGKETGVFAGFATIEDAGNPLLAAVNIGNDKLCEIHLIDWEGVVKKNTEVSLELKKKVREEMHFAGLDELKSQIAKDVAKIKHWYENGELI